MEQIEDKEPINANAKYIIFNIQNKKIWIDMNDILDIIPIPQYVGSSIYQVIFKDGLSCNIQIDKETLDFYQNFKNNIDNKK